MTPRAVNALVLAAGRSSRMGGPNKLTALFDGRPLLRRSVDTALASDCARTIVVLGHEAERLAPLLAGCAMETLVNPDPASGLSSSLRLGFAAAKEGADGVLVCLADQPALRPEHLDRLVAAFRSEPAGSIVVASDKAEWGNPAIIPADLAPSIEALRGDRGARGILAANAERVRLVDIGPAALLDVDTPEALRAAGGSFAAADERS